ncbi:MAG: RNA polymerase sigma factor [Parvularculaceae bacterium]
MALFARNYEEMDDRALAACAARRDPAAIRLITTRNNQRLFRTAWSVARQHADAEELVQEAYLKAFQSIGQFAGDSSLSTWLTRITLNTALDRKRASARRRAELISNDVAMLDEYRSRMSGAGAGTPESALMNSELSALLKAAVAGLPDGLRSVFVLREIEGMSSRETSAVLGVAEALVNTRLMRARKKLRDALAPNLKAALAETLTFAGADCERMTAAIIERFLDTSASSKEK